MSVRIMEDKAPDLTEACFLQVSVGMHLVGLLYKIPHKRGEEGREEWVKSLPSSVTEHQKGRALELGHQEGLGEWEQYPEYDDGL